MGFEKGHKKYGGRTKKSPNKKSKILKEYIQEIGANPSLRKKLLNELKSEDLKGKQFVDAMLSIYEFITPKFNKVDPNQNKLPASITINMIAAERDTTKTIDIDAEIIEDNQEKAETPRLREGSTSSE